MTDQQVQEVTNGMFNLALDKLSDSEKKTLNDLRDLHKQHDEIEKQYREEWNELKTKYQKLKDPIYRKRYSVLTKKDESTVPSDGTTQASQDDSQAPDSDKTQDKEETDVHIGTAGLPKFWLTALKNHRLLADMIETHDEPVLAYLEDIQSEWFDDKEQSSFRLIFKFSENPYFEPSTIVKSYILEQPDDGKDEVLSSTDWQALRKGGLSEGACAY